MQFDFFPVQSSWQRPAGFPDLKGPIAIDTETKDPGLKTHCPGWAINRGHICGVAVKTADYRAYYPVRHEGGDNFDPDTVFRWLAAQVKKPGERIFANASYDLGWLKTEGVTIDPEAVHDVLLLAPLIDENRYTYNLDGLGKDYIGKGKDETMLKAAARQWGIAKDEIKAGLHKLPGRYAGPYAEEDVEITWHLFTRFFPEIEKQNLAQVYKLERDIMPIMMTMRQRGLRVDLEQAHRLRAQYVQKERDSITQLRALTGEKVDPYSATSVAIAFDKLGISYSRTRTGQPSVTAEFLETMTHPVGKLVRDARRYQKAYSTFLDSYIINREVNGRIHAQFNQLPSSDGGTVGGRFSSSNPNLQNIPGRDPEIGPAIRGLFLPEQGERWAAVDYANQEPRITVHFAHVCRMPGAQDAVDRYKANPLVSYHRIVQELIQDKLPKHLDPYKTAKVINLGKAYGMGGAKLCAKLGLPTAWIQDQRQPGKMREVAGEEGWAIIQAYDRCVPFVTKLAQLCEGRAKGRGYITTLSGRRCRFAGKFPDYRKALNRLVQGTAADQTKIAMVQVAAEGGKMLLTMHDELGISVSSDAEIRRYTHIMEHAIELSVPFVCDVDVGDSWGGARPFKDTEEFTGEEA